MTSKLIFQTKWKKDNLDDIQTHVNNMFAASAVVSCSGVTLECIRQIAIVKVMISKIIVPTPDTLFDWIGFVVFQIGVKLFQF